MTGTPFPDEPFTGATLIDLAPTPLAVVRHEGVRVDDLVALFDAGYPAIEKLLEEGTLAQAGPAVAVYYGDPMETFDLELGFPVESAPLQPIRVGEVVVRASSLPSGPAYASTYVGGYDGLGSAWGAFTEAVPATPVGVWIESYVSEPEHTPAPELRTDLILPVQG